MMIGGLEAACNTQPHLFGCGPLLSACQARLDVFYQPITVCGLKASPSGVDAGADHKESISLFQTIGEFIPDLVGGLVRLDNPGAVELQSSFPELRNAL
jgi:hypothetical protein